MDNNDDCDDYNNIIKADEYEPDLFNDMSVQEEITVGSSSDNNNMLSSYQHQNDYNTGNNNNMINTNNNSTIVKVLNASSINHNQQQQQQGNDMKNKPKLIYIKQAVGGNLSNSSSLKTIKLPNNFKNLKVIPLSRFNQDMSQQQHRIIPISSNNSVQLGGTTGGARIFNPAMLRGNIQVTRLNNLNLAKFNPGQKILITNKYSKMTPIINMQQHTNSSGTQYLHHQHNTILQPISGGGNTNCNQSGGNQTTVATALKLEPGDSGFYNLTGGNGPTRYYPRLHSPDKDSLDGSQEQLSNVYKTNGLRKYARSVCDKVKEKGTTTYSEVADELVHEYAAEHPMIPAQQLHYIQKNIRRRVYDALNVLMALKVLDKEKKEIKWKGLPVNLLEECKQLEEEKSRKTELLQQRVEELSELVLQLISYKNLVGRNRQREKEASAPLANERIKLPFLVITTNNSTIIDCNISPEKLEYMFTFDQPFEMQDEFQTLKQSGFTLRLGTSQCTESQYKRCLELVPNTLRFYVEAIYQQRPAIVPDFVSLHRRNMVAAAAQARSNKNLSLSSVNNTGHNSFLQISGGGGGGGSSHQSYHHQQHHLHRNNTSGGSAAYWSTEHDQSSPSLMSATDNKHYESQKRFSSAVSNTSWADHHSSVGGSGEPLQKYRLTSLNNNNNSSSNHNNININQSSHHNFISSSGGGGSTSGIIPSSYDTTKFLHQPHDLEDEIEVMDEEADFPSD